MDMVKNALYRFIATPTWLSIVSGAALVAWQWQTGALPEGIQYVFVALLLFLIGIPHGAVDHLVEKETAHRAGKPFYLSLFLVRYLATMLFYGLIWVFLPSASLVFFLLISAWHFGETDIEKAPSTRYWQVARLGFGSFVLLWLLLPHAAETTPILMRITQNNAAIMATWAWSVGHKTLLLSFFLSFTLIFVLLAQRQFPIEWYKMRLLRLVFILVLTYFLPLLPAFALYFGGWHALCSFQNICQYVLKNQGENAKIAISSAFYVWTKTLGFSFLAFLGLLFGGWYWLHFLQTWDPLPVLFIFLSLITLPHLQVMHRMSTSLPRFET